MVVGGGGVFYVVFFSGEGMFGFLGFFLDLMFGFPVPSCIVLYRKFVNLEPMGGFCLHVSDRLQL